MAVQKIEYANKVRGDLYTSANANEVKQVVNNNADELSALSRQLTETNQSVGSMSQSITNLREETKISVVQQSNMNATIAPNKLNVWGSVTFLSLAFTAGTAGVVNEYMLEFTVSGSEFTLTLPQGIRWVENPEWKHGHTYQVSILNNLAVYADWEAQS